MKEKIKFKLNERVEHLKALNRDFYKSIEQAGKLLKNSIFGNKIIVFGNGGSATQASHFAAELVNRLYKSRQAINAIALTTDIANITSIANDIGYDFIFSRQLEAIGKREDIAIGFTTSGKSGNILKAFEIAKKQGLKTIGICGDYSDLLRENGADVIISVNAKDTAIIQEIHLFVLHFLAEQLENFIINSEYK